MAKPSGRRQNRPMSISTHHQRRSIIMTVLFLIGLGIAIFLYCAFGLHMFERQAQQDNANTQSPVTATEENGTVEASQLNIETAVNKIDTYYSLLSQKKSDQLRNEGFETAAGAVEMGWLDDIDYSVDANNINPDATAFPAPVGSYAGNDVYSISSFFSSLPSEPTIHSIITGDTQVCGWIYYDSVANSWNLIDPTIPTATQAASATQISRGSEDGGVSTEVSTPGVFSNSWWAYAMVSVDVTSTSTDYDVSITLRDFDDGITADIPSTLLAGINRSSVGQPIEEARRNANANANGNSNDADDENADENGNDNSSDRTEVTDRNNDGRADGRAAGVCVIYRGTLDNFDPTLIGKEELKLDGDICPVTIVAGDEDVTPIVTIGTDSAQDIAKLMNEEQMERYGINPDAVNEDDSDANGGTIVDDNANQNGDAAQNGADSNAQTTQQNGDTQQDDAAGDGAATIGDVAN